MIYIRESFVDVEQCEHLIGLYNSNQQSAFSYFTNYPLPISSIHDSFLSSLLSRINHFAHEVSDVKIKLDNPQIVRWPEGSFMPPHRDPGEDVFAGILYLNDDYEGGYTGFNHMEVRPEQGKFILFKNSFLDHWVTPVRKGERYTVAVWFTRQ